MRTYDRRVQTGLARLVALLLADIQTQWDAERETLSVYYSGQPALGTIRITPQ